MKKLATGQGEDYTTGRLNYEYIKNHDRSVDLSRQNEFDVDPKAIQQTEFVGQLKKLDGDGNASNAGNDQSMFILMILEKIKETRLKFPQGSATVFLKMANYQEARVRLTNTQLKKLKSAAKNKQGHY